MTDQVYIVVSQYQQRTDEYGGRMTNFDIHDVFSHPVLAQDFINGADTTGPSVPDWRRTFSIVQRPLRQPDAV
jgi:hypothetical protein